MLERIRDLMIVDALKDSASNSILRDIPDDQMERMQNQANRIGTANLSRAADIAAEGLTQMRGATAPRLMLELICGRILLPIGDNGESGMLSRIERLERAENIAPMTTPAPAKSVEKKEAPAAPVKAEAAPAEVKVEVPAAKVNSAPGAFDIAALRRAWPDVIEDVKKRRRLTWSLLSASAQVLAVDDKAITIGIVNAGARDSFIRSESDEILRKAFVDVVGIDRKIECVVDPSIDTNTPAARETRTSEAPSDKTLLSGAALLAQELGAKVIESK
jgi:DNA polymerase-3 subunit gamma/tau